MAAMSGTSSNDHNHITWYAIKMNNCAQIEAFLFPAGLQSKHGEFKDKS